ncbi:MULTISPECIES: ROK family protein [unclassified Isoptericola]|uniref:ROK family protein n=1 Tax=unclassified Isoptericola TaxID=2623355 RepID=UPI003650FA8B
MSFTTVTRLTSAMVAGGLLVELDPRRTAGRVGAGRPETPLDFAPGGRLLVGVHIRRDATTASVFDLGGARLSSTRVAHEPGSTAAEVVRRAVRAVAELIEGAGAGRVLGVGVSTGGRVDHDRRTVVESPLLGWDNVDLGAPFDALGLPVHVDTSVRCLALMDLWGRGGGSGDTSLTILVAGVVGAALIVDRRLLRGPGATGGEVEHFPVAGGPGERCRCGRIDCLGQVVSNRGLHARAAAAGVAPPDVAWNDLVAADSPAVAAMRQDRARWLGESTGALIELLNPATTTITGFLGDRADVDETLRVARERCRDLLGGPERSIVYRPIDQDVWDRASASLVLDDFLRRPTGYEPALR